MSHNVRRGEWTIFSIKGNRLEQLLNYFQAGTQKYKLLQWLTGDTKAKPILKWSSSISDNKILDVVASVKSCDAEFLRERFGCSHTTMRQYLKILATRREITLSTHPKRLSLNVSEHTSIFLYKEFHKQLFEKVRDVFIKHKNCALFLEIGAGAFSAWYVRKNRIPIVVLKKLGPAIGINIEEILANTTETDHEVAELL